MKKVVFFEKFNNLGHRRYIAKVIENNFKSASLEPWFLIGGDRNENGLKKIIEFSKKHNVKSFHLLTLDDCLDDFKDERLLEEIKSRDINISGTLFRFTDLQLVSSLKFIKNFFTRKQKRQFVLFLLKTNLLKKVFIPDERSNKMTVYPIFRKKIVYLPDFPKFFPQENELKEYKLKKQKDKIDFLVFGDMKKYKGIDILVKALEGGQIKTNNKKIKITFAGKKISDFKINTDKNLEIELMDRYIEDEEARQLFLRADCVIMPFKKSFLQSSGNYAIACAFGNLVIVPDKGVLAYRTAKHKNGYTFRAGDSESLSLAIDKCIKDIESVEFPVSGSINYYKKIKIEKYCEILEKEL